MVHVLSVRNVSIAFPGVQALKEVNVDFCTGEVHAVVGANGAGKSTLMKVLAGVYTHYTGEIFLDKRPVRIAHPADARALGIDIVYQEVDTALFPHLSVAENIALGWLTHGAGSRAPWVSWRAVYALGERTLATLGVELDVRRPVQLLTLAEKQLVLIARALVEKRRFLILDEPTAALSRQETQQLFRVIRELVRRDGLGVLFISHRIPEICEISDRITILRDGQVVTTASRQEMPPEAIVQAMLGKALSSTRNAQQKKRVAPQRPYVVIRDFTDRFGKFRDVALHADRGEVIGIAGLVGAGKTELCQAMIGARPLARGMMTLGGEAVALRSPSEAVRKGIVLIPEERRKEGLWIDETVACNLTIASLDALSVFGFVRRRKVERQSERMVKMLAIKTPDVNQRVAFLSGGNQQKVVIGKWLMGHAKVYIFDEPTKGIDIGAKQEILQLIRQLADEGHVIFYATSEFSELLQVADRIYVLYAGTIVSEMTASEATESTLLAYATGGI